MIDTINFFYNKSDNWALPKIWDINEIAVVSESPSINIKESVESFSIEVEDWPSIDQLPTSKLFSPRKEIDGFIDWGADASHITRLCKALGWRDWVKTHFRGEEIIIRKSKVVIDDKPNEPGTVIQLDPNLIVRCGINSLEIKEALIPKDLSLGDVLFTNKLMP